MPFYYYAKSWCENISALMVFSVFALFVAATLEIIVMATRKHNLTFASTFLGIICVVLLLTVCITALDMKNGKILSTYCSGNPSCSIRSSAILPFLSMLIYTAIDEVVSVKLANARRLLK